MVIHSESGDDTASAVATAGGQASRSLNARRGFGFRCARPAALGAFLAIVGGQPLLQAAGATGLMAQTATAYVPGLDRAYDQVELLAAAGLINTLAAGERPHSRATFAGWAEEASARAKALGDGALSPRVREALDDLLRRFEPRAETVALREARAELWGARSPSRRLGRGAAAGIDGVLNPMLQANQGRRVADGWTAAAELLADAAYGPAVVAMQPRVWLSLPRGPESASASSAVQSGYGRLLIGPMALEAGRNSVSSGYGRYGGPLLSHNARGLTMIRLATEHPVRLPGPFAGWGAWRASALAAYMGTNRDIAGSWLSAFRLSNRPWAYTELALVYVNLQGGRGAPRGSFLERAADILLPFRGGTIELSDKAGGGDLHVTVPGIRTHFFGNFVATDLRANVQQLLRGFWQDVTWAFGARTYGVGPEGRLDFWADAKSSGPLVHTHHQFTSGLTLDDHVLGDPLGPNARSVAGGVAWTSPDWELQASAALERYSADEWYLASAPQRDHRSWTWTKAAEYPSEIRRRLTLGWQNLPGAGAYSLAVRLGYEHTSNFAFSGESRDSFLARVYLRWVS